MFKRKPELDKEALLHTLQDLVPHIVKVTYRDEIRTAAREAACQGLIALIRQIKPPHKEFASPSFNESELRYELRKMVEEEVEHTFNMKTLHDATLIDRIVDAINRKQLSR